MAELVALFGPSGSGKSTSIEKLEPKQTVIINVAAKPLPFKGWKKNYVEGISSGGNYAAISDSKSICAAIKFISDSRPEITHLVLDDVGYNMSFQALEKATDKGFDKFSIIAKDMFNILNAARLARPDLKVFFVFHDEVEDMGNGKKRKIRTIGKMLDSTLTVEGLFTIVLYADVQMNNMSGIPEYKFLTQTDGVTTAKSPKGMFDTKEIPNDLALVAAKMDEYNNG